MSNWSLNSLAWFSVSSSTKSNPYFLRVSETCLYVSPPSIINGFNSLADLPINCMAIASRFVSSVIPPKAVITSWNTSSLSRKLPSESLTDTPSSLNSFFCVLEPFAAEYIDFSSRLLDFAIASTETSTRSAAAAYFCKLSVLIPVTFASVFKSSAVRPDFTASAPTEPATAAPAIESPRIASPADVNLFPSSFTCSDAARSLTFPTALNWLLK